MRGSGEYTREDNAYVARSGSERGEVFLLRRGRDGALELRVNGVFVMDTVNTSAERLLGTATLAAIVSGDDPIRVLIGGLGLGFTLQAVLADDRVSSAHVVEIEPSIVEWHRQGLVPDTVDAFGDQRVLLSVGDVGEVVAQQDPRSCEVILLDVDNGPGYLVYDRNAAVYRHDFLVSCRDKLVVRGIVAIWSASPAPELDAAMRYVFAVVEELAVPVILNARELTYHLYIGRTPRADRRE